MTPIASTTGFTLALAAYATGVPSGVLSPPVLWGTVALWGLVATLLAALAGIVASAREASEAESNHTTPFRPTLGTVCQAGAH